MKLKQFSILVAYVAAGMPVPAETVASSQVTFHKDVVPVLQKNCQGCHRPGQIAPMSFLTYERTRPWAKAIKAAVLSKKMPPWNADPAVGHFTNDRSLRQSELEIITNGLTLAPQRAIRRTRRRPSYGQTVAGKSNPTS